MKSIKYLIALAIASITVMASAQDAYNYVVPEGANNFYHSYKAKEQSAMLYAQKIIEKK